MANPLVTLEAANLFCGIVPGNLTPSNHLVLSELKLPAWDEQFVDHRAGGAPVAIEVDTIFARPQCDFTLAGWNDQVSALIASWADNENWFFAYCVLRDRLSGEAMQGAATMKGRLGRADPQNWRKGDLHHWAYSIRGLTFYQLKTGSGTLYDWDFFENRLIVGGTDRNADVNEILKTGSVTTTAPPNVGA